MVQRLMAISMYVSTIHKTGLVYKLGVGRVIFICKKYNLNTRTDVMDIRHRFGMFSNDKYEKAPISLLADVELCFVFEFVMTMFTSV